METREQTAAKNLKIAAIGYAVKHGDKRLEKKLLTAAVKYAEEQAKAKAFLATLELGAVNAAETDRVMRGHQAREVPPGLTKAISKVKRAEKKRDLLERTAYVKFYDERVIREVTYPAGFWWHPKGSRSKFYDGPHRTLDGALRALRKSGFEVVAKQAEEFVFSKMKPFEMVVLGYVHGYGHKPEDRTEEKAMARLEKQGLIERCTTPSSPKRRYRLTEFGHEVHSVIVRGMKE